MSVERLEFDVTQPASSSATEFSRGFPIIIGSMIGTGVGVASLPFYTAGAFMIPLQQAMGWSRTDLSLGLSASTLLLAAGAPLCGRLADRYGTRPVATASLVVLALGFLGMTQLRGPAWTYIVAMGAIALLSAGSSPITFTCAINSAFDRGRGLALGLTLTGMGIAAALGPTFVQWLIGAYGWSAGYLGLAVIVALAVPVVALLVKDSVRARTVASPMHRPKAEPRSWVTEPAFWTLGVAFFLVALAQSGPIAHLIPMLTDAGVSAAPAARTAGVLGMSVMLGRIATGWALDRIFAPAIAAVVFGLAAFGCLVFGLGAGHSAPAIAALLGFSLGAEVDLLSYMTSRYFGLATYGAIYGCLYGAFSVGAAAGPVLAGLAYDRLGTYRPSLLASSVGLAIACVLIGRIGPYPRSGGTAR